MANFTLHRIPEFDIPLHADNNDPIDFNIVGSRAYVSQHNTTRPFPYGTNTPQDEYFPDNRIFIYDINTRESLGFQDLEFRIGRTTLAVTVGSLITMTWTDGDVILPIFATFANFRTSTFNVNTGAWYGSLDYKFSFVEVPISIARDRGEFFYVLVSIGGSSGTIYQFRHDLTGIPLISPPGSGTRINGNDQLAFAFELPNYGFTAQPNAITFGNSFTGEYSLFWYVGDLETNIFSPGRRVESAPYGNLTTLESGDTLQPVDRYIFRKTSEGRPSVNSSLAKVGDLFYLMNDDNDTIQAWAPNPVVSVEAIPPPDQDEAPVVVEVVGPVNPKNAPERNILRSLNKGVVGLIPDYTPETSTLPAFTPPAPGKTALGSIPAYSLPGGTSKSLLDGIPKITPPDDGPAPVDPQVTNTPAEGIPIITGDTNLGDTLTADTTRITDPNGLTNVQFSFIWIRLTPDEETGERLLRYRLDETGPTYTTVLEDVGSQLTVTVVFTDDAGFSERVTSPPTPIIGQRNLTVTGAPVISGTPMTGETLTVDTSSIDDPNGISGATFTLQWFADGVAIPGAQAARLVLGLEQGDAVITVRVTFTDDDGYSEQVTSAGTDPVVVTNSPPSGLPLITGETEVGETLTADTSGITDINGLSSATFAYQWKRVTAGVVADISGATDGTYVLSSADERTTLRVTVTYTDDDGYAESLTSRDSATIVPRNNPATGAPTVTGTATEGQVLTASETGIMDTNGLTTAVYLWRWVRVDTNSEANIQGATGATYTITAADVGKKLKVRVSFTDDAGHMEELESVSTAAVQAFNYEPTGLPVITGDASTGSTLSVDTSGIADQNGLTNVVFSYQWISDGALNQNIEGATSSDFTIPIDREGRHIAVVVTFRDDSGYTHSLTSDPTRTIRRGNVRATGIVWVDGPLLLGQAVRGGYAEIADDNGLTNPTFSFQWVRVDAERTQRTPITRATLETYTPGEADIGHYILFEVSFTDDDGYSEALTSPFGRLVSRTNRPHTGTVVVVRPAGTGSVLSVGNTLSVDLSGVMDPDGLTNPLPSYRWLRDGVDIRPPVRGATYVLTLEDVGHSISVRVIMQDDSGFSLVSQSDEVGPVTPPNRPATGQPTISGDLTRGEVLTADISNIADLDGIERVTFAYQWVRLVGMVESDITGATGTTYTTVAADEGHRLLVRVTFTDDRGFEEGVVSDPTGLIKALVNTPATGQPTIRGVAREGETLAIDTFAVADPDGLVDAVFAYQWLRDGADISGATSNTYTLTRDDIGSVVSIRVSFTDDSGFSEVLTSPGTAAVLSNNSPVSGAVTITGTLEVGQTLTADTSGIADTNGLTMATFVYQWIRGSADISGATGSTYEIVADDVGESLKVRVSFTDDAGYDETVESAGTIAIPQPIVNTPATGRPTITGVARVGETLTASAAGIRDANGIADAVFVYQWRRGTRNIGGATGTTYTLVDADAGSNIRVQVSFTDDDGFSERRRSLPTAAVIPANSPVSGVPIITGTLTEGETLTADTSGITDTNGLTSATFTYQWVRGSSDISGATGSTYEIVAADVGESLKVRVMFTDDAGYDETVESAPTDTITALVNTPATGQPAIAGTARETQPLTADTSGIADANGLTSVTFAYQWLRDGADISGATSSTYLLVRADIGAAITVRVTFTDDDGFSEMLTSPATAAVLSNNSPVGGALLITGTLAVGETLTADTSGITDTNGLTMVTFVYQWIRGSTDISGATSSTYEIVAADVGESLKVRVTFMDDAGYDETLESAGTTNIPQPLVNVDATGQPTISGIPNLGSELTVDTSGIMDANGLTSATFTYQWIRVDGMMETDIAGETGTSYFLVQADVGKTVKVRVSFTDDDGFDESLTSPATAEVTDVPPVFGEIDMLTPIGQPGTLSNNTRVVTFDATTRTAFQAAWNSGAYTFFVVQLGWVDNSIQRYGEATISRIPGLTLANTEVRFLLPEDRWLAGNDGRAELINGATELTLDTSNSARFPTGMTAQLYGASSSLQINPNVDATNTLEKIAIGGTVYAINDDDTVFVVDGQRTVGTTGGGNAENDDAASFFTRRAGSTSAVTFNSLILYSGTRSHNLSIVIGTYDGTNSEALLTTGYSMTAGTGPNEIRLPSTVQIPGDKGFYIAVASDGFLSRSFSVYDGDASAAIAAPDDFDFAGGYENNVVAPNMEDALAFTLSYSYTTIAVTPAGPRTVGTVGSGDDQYDNVASYFTRRSGSTSAATFNSLILHIVSSGVSSAAVVIGTYDGTNSEALLTFNVDISITSGDPIEVPLPNTVRIPGDKGFYITAREVLGRSRLGGYTIRASAAIAAPDDFDFAGGYAGNVIAPHMNDSLAFTLSYTTIPDAYVFDTTGPYLGFKGLGNQDHNNSSIYFTRQAGSTDPATLTHLSVWSAEINEDATTLTINFGTWDGTTASNISVFNLNLPATGDATAILQPIVLELPANLVVPGDKGFYLTLQSDGYELEVLNSGASNLFITDSDDFDFAGGTWSGVSLISPASIDQSPIVRIRYTV